MSRKQGPHGLKQVFRSKGVLLVTCALLAACAAPPELVYPTEQGKRVSISSSASTSLAETTLQSQTTVVLAHDAADIQRLSEALTQLQMQLSHAQAGGRLQGVPVQWPLSSPSNGRGILPSNTLAKTNSKSALPMPPLQPASKPYEMDPGRPNATSLSAQTPVQDRLPSGTPSKAASQLVPVAVKGVIQITPPAPSVAFHLEPSDTTLLGVLWRWSRQLGWQMRLNGTLVDGQRFPSHPVAYADVGLERTADMPPAGHPMQDALGVLLQAHSAYQNQLELRLVLQADKAELEVQSTSKTPPPATLTTESKPMSPAVAH